MIGGERRGRPLGLHTSGQTTKVKGLQSAYMAALFGIFGAKSLASREEFGSIKNGNPNSSREVKLFSIKYLESDKRTLIIYFNELLFHLWRGVWGLASRFDRSSVKRP